MGADMIVSVVAQKRDTKLNFEAGDEFVKKLDLTDESVIQELVEYGNLDEDEYFDDDGKPKAEEIRSWLLGKLSEFEACLSSRGVCSIAVRDLWLYITGGLSWGDDTDEGYIFSTISSVSGLLSSMGFVEDWWEEDKTVTPEEEAAALESIKKASP
jgi:hypothetical protein